MYRSRPVSLGLVGLFLWSSACTKWVPLEPPYPQWLEEYGKLQITNERGVPVVFREPQLKGDSVWGTVVTSHWEHGDLKHSERVAAIPVESVQKIEKRGSDAATTITLWVGVGLLAGLIGAAGMSGGLGN